MLLGRAISFVFFLTISCHLFADGVVMLEVDTGSRSLATQASRASAILKYELEELVGDGWEKRFFQSPYYDVKHAANFPAVTGFATCLNRSGQFQKVRFWTVESRTAFTSMVEDLVQKRGVKAKVAGSDDDKVISVSEPQKSEDGKRTMRWVDARVRYVDGLMAIGEPAELEGVDLERIKALAIAAQGKHWYYYFDPTAADPTFWQSVVENAFGITAPALQQFDGEGDEDYKLRRAGLEAKRHLLKMLVEDTESFAVWTEWPQAEKEPFRFRVHLNPKDNSSLKRMLAELRTGTEFSSVNQTKKPLVAVTVNLLLPDLLAQWLAYECSRMNAPLGKEILVRLMAEQRIVGSAGICAEQSGLLGISGCADQLSEGFIEQLNKQPLEEDGAAVAYPIVPPWDYAGLSLEMATLRRKGSMLCFDVGAPAGSVSRELSESEHPLKHGEIIRLSFDASLTADESQRERCLQFWTMAEQLFDNWTTRVVRERMPGLVAGHYRTFVPHLAHAGDWSAEASIQNYDDGLVVEGRVGHDLHEYGLARQIAMTQNVMMMLKRPE